MADSAQNKSEPQAEKPSEALVVVKNKDGSVRETLRSPRGTFVAKKKPLIPTIEYVRARRKRLYKLRTDTGRFDGMTESMSIMEELLEIIHTPISVDAKSGLPDSKHMSAKIQAAELLHLITEGKPAPSEQELDKLERQPITAYFVEAPQLARPEVVDGDKIVEKPKQPSWAEVTDIVTNPKK
jgi:hypothetical protein